MNVFGTSTLSSQLMQQYKAFMKGEYSGKPQGETWQALQEAVTLPGVGNKAMELVSTLQKTQSLTLISSNLTVLGPLTHMKRLEKLEIKNNKNDLDPRDGNNYVQGSLKLITALSTLTVLRQLKVVDQMVVSVKPLAELNLLRYLNLEGNKIKTVAALASLTGIKRLNLSNNEFEDVAPLAGMVGMEYLYLSENQIKTISPLANMEFLKVLLFDNNEVVNINVLAQLSALEFVTFNNNLIDELDVLKELPNLSGFLKQWNNTNFDAFKDTSSAVSRLGHKFAVRFAGGHLDCLDLSNNRLPHLGDEWFDNQIFSPLRSLRVNHNMITNLNGFHLRNIVNLQLAHNQVSILDQLQYLITLEVLNLQANSIEDITPLKYLSNKLRDLNLSENNIEDIEPLAELRNLVVIDLHSNRIKNISPLSTLSKVSSLPLQYNLIKNLKPLKYLTQLIELNLADNRIRDLNGVGALANLQKLNLERNKILEIKQLSNLKRLTYVNLKKNRIRDVRPVQHVKVYSIGEQKPPGTTSTQAVDNAKEAEAIPPGKTGQTGLAVAAVLVEGTVEEEESDEDSGEDTSDSDFSEDESPPGMTVFEAVAQGLEKKKFAVLLKKAPASEVTERDYVAKKYRHLWGYAAHLGRVEMLDEILKDKRVATKLASKQVTWLKARAQTVKEKLESEQADG